jgi:hypothetical protein
MFEKSSQFQSTAFQWCLPYGGLPKERGVSEAHAPKTAHKRRSQRRGDQAPYGYIEPVRPAISRRHYLQKESFRE